MLQPDLGLLESVEALISEADALLQARHDLDRAFRLYDQALRQGADPLRVAQAQWMSAMLAGNFAAAWEVSDRVLIEQRRRGMSCAERPYHERWVWDGSALQGRNVLIRCYHGLGDAMQFLRFATPLRHRVRGITVQAVAALRPILERIDGIDEIAVLGEADPPYDIDIEANELPHALRVSLQIVGRDRPYIAIDPTKVAARREALGAPGRLKVGLVWSAGGWRPERSIPLRLLRPLWQTPEIDFVVLQRGDGLAELDRIGEVPLRHWSRTTDLLATADTVSALDLVVTVDTMIAHLAGALAVPTWALLHSHADWRWLGHGDRSPWYPSMRLFRQRVPGHWTDVIEDAAAALRALRSSTDR